MEGPPEELLITIMVAITARLQLLGSELSWMLRVKTLGRLLVIKRRGESRIRRTAILRLVTVGDASLARNVALSHRKKEETKRIFPSKLP